MPRNVAWRALGFLVNPLASSAWLNRFCEPGSSPAALAQALQSRWSTEDSARLLATATEEGMTGGKRSMFREELLPQAWGFLQPTSYRNSRSRSWDQGSNFSISTSFATSASESGGGLLAASARS